MGIFSKAELFLLRKHGCAYQRRVGGLNMISNKENSMYGYSRASLIQAEWDQRVAVTWILPVTENNNNNNSNS